MVYCLEGAVTGEDHRGHAIAGNRPLRSIREDLCQSEGVAEGECVVGTAGGMGTESIGTALSSDSSRGPVVRHRKLPTKRCELVEKTVKAKR